MGKRIIAGILTKNSDRTIGKCLDSLIKYVQPEKIVIVDGGSHDETLSIGRRYNTKIYIASSLNLGGARKRLLQLISDSGYDFSVMVDSDVFIKPNFLQIIEQYEGADVIEGRVVNIGIGKGVTPLTAKRGYTFCVFLNHKAAKTGANSNIDQFDFLEDHALKRAIQQAGLSWIRAKEPIGVHDSITARGDSLSITFKAGVYYGKLRYEHWWKIIGATPLILPRQGIRGAIKHIVLGIGCLKGRIAEWHTKKSIGGE